MKLTRISSGIPGLDKLVEGGFKKNSINLFAGEPGAGKTIFAIQFLIDGLSKGENVLYITFEESQEKIFKHMERFGWDLRRFEKEGKIKVFMMFVRWWLYRKTKGDIGEGIFEYEYGRF